MSYMHWTARVLYALLHKKYGFQIQSVRGWICALFCQKGCTGVEVQLKSNHTHYSKNKVGVKLCPQKTCAWSEMVGVGGQRQLKI
jgi:hypothetical protein